MIEEFSCPVCRGPWEALVLYLDPSDGPYYGCPCGWIEQPGPDKWTVEKVLAVLEHKETR